MKKGKIYNEESFACPHCGNAVFGNLIDTVSRKIARGVGTAAIDWIPGSGLFRDKVQDFYEDTYCSIDDQNEFDFECPACRHRWRWTYYQAKQHRYQGGSSQQNLSVGAFFVLILVSLIFVAGIYLFNYVQIYSTDGGLNSAGWAAWILTIIGGIVMLCIAYAYLSGGFVGFLAFLAIISIDSTCYLLLKNNATSENEIIEAEAAKDVDAPTSTVSPLEETDSFIKDTCLAGSYVIPLSNGILVKCEENSSIGTLYHKSTPIGTISVELIPDEGYNVYAQGNKLARGTTKNPIAWKKVPQRNIIYASVDNVDGVNKQHLFFYCGHYKGEQISIKLSSTADNDAVVQKFFQNIVANIRYEEQIPSFDKVEQNEIQSSSDIVTTEDSNDSIIATYDTPKGKVSYIIKNKDSYDGNYFFRYDHSSKSYHSFSECLEREMAMFFKDVKVLDQYIYIISNNGACGGVNDHNNDKKRAINGIFEKKKNNKVGEMENNHGLGPKGTTQTIETSV